MTASLSEVQKIKRLLYTSIARMTWQDELLERIDDLPDEILETTHINYRCCEHKEKAVLKERIRIALGLAPEEVAKHATLREMAEQALHTDRKRECTMEMMTVACDRCPIDRFVVTDACRNCVAHYCQNACPKDAITVINNRAYIDRSRCIECGRCAKSCSYHAIVEITRPCEHACAAGAIHADKTGVAQIDCEKCVGCGACVNACPFGSIGDYTHILRVIKMLRQTERPVYALVAPSFVGQFGPKAGAAALKNGLLELGFTHVIEVAKGAEDVARAEASEYLERMEAGQKVMTTSCCPAFVGLIRKHYPELQDLISHTPSPMAVLASEVKGADQMAFTVFIGPCLGKKGEAAKLPQVDAVLTFEELACLLVARDINLAAASTIGDLQDAGPMGRGFAKSGGVTAALMAALPDNCHPPLVKRANGLQEAVSICKDLAGGKLDASFIEGMGCEGGCIAGPGTLINPLVAEKLLDRFCQAPVEVKRSTGN